MEIIKTNFKDLRIYKKETFKDKRGYTRELFKNNLIKKKFPFELLSLSKKMLFVVCIYRLQDLKVNLLQF